MANAGVSAVFLSRPEEGNAAGHLLSRAGDGAAPGLLLPSNSSPADTDMKGCANGDLMDSFGIFLQGLLGVVAFSTLMCKFSRPLKEYSTPKTSTGLWGNSSHVISSSGGTLSVNVSYFYYSSIKSGFVCCGDVTG